MAYRVYEADGYLLGSTARGEANRLLYILTPNLGLIQAAAQSVRKGTSKLRYGLQDFSRARLSLVKGREYWRVTGVMSDTTLWAALRDNRTALKSLARIAVLVRRLVHGEADIDTLYRVFDQGVSFVCETPLSDEEMRVYEAIFAARILSALGYFRAHPGYGDIKAGSLPSREEIERIAPHYRALVLDVNNALRESHL